jgi:hypothetical protein
MSAIEGAAKPVVGPMVQGIHTTLDAAAQRTVANWVTLKGISETRSGPVGCANTQTGPWESTTKEQILMAQTTLAEGAITPSPHNTVTVELVQPADLPAFVQITWPEAPTVCDPRASPR